MTNQHQRDRQEEQAIREQRNKDIDLYGFGGAFKKDRQIMSYEKAKWMKKEGRLENV